MDSFEWNKIVGAILGTLLLLFIVKEVAHITFSGEEHEEELAYKIEIPETETQQAGEGKPEPVDFGVLLRQASAEQGEVVARRCLQCHTFEKGGGAKTGPNLWGILGRDIASKPDFRYSNALSKLEGGWTYERIYDFVAAPSRYAPGTSMTFAGLRRQQERINLLAFLRTKTDEPPPLPEPLPEEPAEGDESPAEEGGPDGAEAPDGGGAAAKDAGAEENASTQSDDTNPGTADDSGESPSGTNAETPDEQSSPENDDTEGGESEDGGDPAEADDGDGKS